MSEYAGCKKVLTSAFMVILTGLMPAVGGLSPLSGILVPWGAGLLALLWVPTAILMHSFWTEQNPMSKMNQMANFLKHLNLAAAVLMLTAIHDWNW